MAWVWRHPKQSDEWGADIDYLASAPMQGTEDLGNKWLDPAVNRPVFRSRSGLKRFKELHCPPIGLSPAVDAVWRDIILRFVPEDRVQFLPIRLIARGEVCDDYFWPIVMDQVFCIDPESSEITQKLKDDKRFIIFRVKTFVHITGCLGSLHLARDARMHSHLLLSNELKEALAATGEDSMFYRPEDIVTMESFMDIPKDRSIN